MTKREKIRRGRGRGKGVFVERNFYEGDFILHETKIKSDYLIQIGSLLLDGDGRDREKHGLSPIRDLGSYRERVCKRRIAASDRHYWQTMIQLILFETNNYGTETTHFIRSNNTQHVVAFVE